MQSLKANTAGVREVSSKVLDIVAWPFRFTNSLVPFDSDEEEEDDEEEVGSKGPSVDNDDLTIAEKQAVAMRLLALVSVLGNRSVCPNYLSCSTVRSRNGRWTTRLELSAA